MSGFRFWCLFLLASTLMLIGGTLAAMLVPATVESTIGEVHKTLVDSLNLP
jgi:hypothetical protein